MTERQILKAQAEGQLSGLEGEGKPLPDRPEAAVADLATQVGYRIMAANGAIPPEVSLARQLADARAAYQQAKPEERKAAMAKIADLEMRLAVARDARRRFMR